VKVVWTNTAIEHLVAVYEHIARDSPRYAQRMIDRITRKSERIGLFPESGRAVPEFESAAVREVYESPYRIIYRVSIDQVDVIAVVHGARQLRPEE
jgi:toxin ParE1/3/4